MLSSPSLSPDGFNETRFILFTNCINTIHWLALVPLYLASTEHEIRAVIFAYSLSLSGTSITVLILAITTPMQA